MKVKFPFFFVLVCTEKVNENSKVFQIIYPVSEFHPHIKLEVRKKMFLLLSSGSKSLDYLKGHVFLDQNIGLLVIIYLSNLTEVKKEHEYFPSISYYFHIPIIFDFLDFHCPNLEKIGTDEKVICYHNISNLLWKKDVLCVRKKSESQKHYKFLALRPRICKFFSRFTFFSSH